MAEDPNNEKGFAGFISALENIPFWLIQKETPASPLEVILALARKSFIFKRYKCLFQEEGRYWGQVAHDLLCRGEVPRWVDHRRFEAQYKLLGKQAWVELYHILFGRQLKKLLGIAEKSGGPILELGCGCGWLVLELARLGKDTEGIDGSESEIALAKFFYEQLNTSTEDFLPKFYGFAQVPQDEQGRVKYEIGDLNNIDLPRGRYSLVISWESLHHIDNFEGLCEQVKLSLKDDGLFIIHETINESISGLRLFEVLTSHWFLKILRWLHKKQTRKEVVSFEKDLFTHYRERFDRGEEPAKILASPFEGVSGTQMLDLLRKHFDVSRKSFHHHHLTEYGSFKALEAWDRDLGFPPSGMLAKIIFQLLKLCDDLAIKFLHHNPRHIFLILKPKPMGNFPVAVSLKDRVEHLSGVSLSREEWQSCLMEAFHKIFEKREARGSDLDTFSMNETFRGNFKPAERLSSYLLISGWYLEEVDFRWTEGSAETYLDFPRGCKMIEIEVMGSPQAGVKNPQKITFFSRGSEVCRFQIERAGWQKVKSNLLFVPPPLSVVRIISDTFCPKEMGLSDDSRTLGVAFRSIQVT